MCCYVSRVNESRTWLLVFDPIVFGFILMWLILTLFIVARSSDSESEATIIFYGCFLFIYFFFSRHTFSDVGKPTSPKLSHKTWVSIQQNLCYSDFFKVPPKTNGAEKPKICIIFHAKRQTISTVIL